MTEEEALLQANGALSRFYSHGYSADRHEYEHYMRIAEHGYCGGCDHCCDVCNRDGHYCAVCNDAVSHNHNYKDNDAEDPSHSE